MKSYSMKVITLTMLKNKAKCISNLRNEIILNESNRTNYAKGRKLR